MRKKILNFPVGLVLFSLSVLLLLPISAMAEGDGGWTTTASPGHIFQTQEGLHNKQKHLVMTVIKPDSKGVEFYWGSASGSVNNTYPLKSMNGSSDMMATWQFDNDTQATVTVESCTTNCLWQPGQVVTLNKFFGDKKSYGSATRVPKTGQTACWNEWGAPLQGCVDSEAIGMDGDLRLGVLPAVPPSGDNPYTVYGWGGTRFTDNLDGTVTDNLTGLIWLKNVNCFGRSRTWLQALSDCNSLKSGSCGLTDGSSHGDWRLPNINELHSLVDPTQSNPALPTGYPFTGLNDVYYFWSSTTVAIDTINSHIVFILNGHAIEAGKRDKGIYGVWAVRSGSGMAEGDGGWTATASPGHIFQTQEGLHNKQKHLVMTVIKPDSKGVEFYWGPALGSVNNTYQLKSMNGSSDMMATWQSDSDTQATVTVESCTTNCLWQPGQVVTLNKFFGDMKADVKIATRVPETGQTECWDEDGNSIGCTGTGQDGEYQLGVLPAVGPSYENPYTIYGWTGTRFTDNLDGTVTDNLTGLTWLKDASCSELAGTDPYGGGNWTTALSASNTLSDGTCGLTDNSSAGDWRLPNINELHSLVDPTQSDPALPGGYPFIGVLSDYYWTSTTYASFANVAWLVYMTTGQMDNVTKVTTSYVWPVRAGN